MASPAISYEYYVRNSIVEFEEDLTHEFKGHTNMCVESIPPHAWLPDEGKRSRGAISKCLNGFLNSGVGGTVYAGIVDEGLVKGIPLTQYKKDHHVASLRDLMERYTPPVDPHRYTIKFVPVVDQNLSDNEIQEVLAFNSRSKADEERRKLPHLMRSHHYCWCDKDAIAQCSNGVLPQDYVMELIIRPWNSDDPRNTCSVGKMKIHPMHKDEAGSVYNRGHGYNTKCTMNDIREAAIPEVKQHYNPKIAKLKEEISQLRSQVLAANRTSES